MKKQFVILTSVTLMGAATLLGCGEQQPQAQTPVGGQTEATDVRSQPEGTGTLQVFANGEDYIRDGFVSKDGWELSFDHVYASFADVMAYQTNPPFQAEPGQDLQAKANQQVQVTDVSTVDLATGTGDDDLPLVGETQAPAGHYNALSWRMVNGREGLAASAPLVMVGRATREGQTVDFTLSFDREMTYLCGEFVGDTRKGFVEPNDAGELEATFHFDHLFGSAEKAPDDTLNVEALGFAPIARLAQNGRVEANMATLQANLSEAEYNQLLQILPALGHAGEGHCRETQLEA